MREIFLYKYVKNHQKSLEETKKYNTINPLARIKHDPVMRRNIR